MGLNKLPTYATETTQFKDNVIKPIAANVIRTITAIVIRLIIGNLIRPTKANEIRANTALKSDHFQTM